MNEPVYLLNMFSDYAPPGEVEKALSQAAIVAADIHAEHRTVHVAAHSQSYVPRRVVETMEREVAALYGLARLEITLTHPESELQKIEPEEMKSRQDSAAQEECLQHSTGKKQEYSLIS